MSRRSYIYNLKMEDLTMNEDNTDRCLFTEDSQKKKPAGDHVHDLCKKYMSDHPTIDYETALKNILRYPGNERLSRTYGRNPSTLI